MQINATSPVIGSLASAGLNFYQRIIKIVYNLKNVLTTILVSDIFTSTTMTTLIVKKTKMIVRKGCYGKQQLLQKD